MQSKQTKMTNTKIKPVVNFRIFLLLYIKNTNIIGNTKYLIKIIESLYASTIFCEKKLINNKKNQKIIENLKSELFKIS